VNISVFIGRRLSFSESSTAADKSSRRSGASAGVPIAIGGIAIAVVIMMISLSVVLGFKEEIRRKIVGFTSEMTVFPQSRTLASAPCMKLSEQLISTITTTLPEAVCDGVIEIPGIIKTDSAFVGVMVKAYADTARGFGFISSHLVEGAMPSPPAESEDPSLPARPEIVLSAANATKLRLAVGDNVDMHFVTNGAMRTRRVTVSGIYDTHLGEYDSRFVYSTPDMARSVAKMPGDCVTALEINGIDAERLPDAIASLSASLLNLSSQTTGSDYYGLDNVLHSGQAYFSWLDLLDTNVVVILVLMALVSGFTLISSMFILILERVRTIGILKSLGATNSQIRGVFIYMAERLVVRGLIIGNLIGLGFILLQHFLHIIPLDAEAYFLSYVPVDLAWGPFIILNAGVIVISAAVLVLPSHMIATLAPSESMRYE
jgi:lipoprotein-releasing system permease protein